MLNLGDFTTSDTLYVPFTTYDSNGKSVTISSFAVTEIEIYKDGSVTQRASDSGYALLDTDGIDFDGVVGLHGFSVDLSDNTDAGFYAAGSQYWIIVNSITVDSQTAVSVAWYFTIGMGGVKATTAGNTLDVTSTGAAGIDWSNIENPTTAVDLSATDIQLADTTTTLTNKTGFSLAATGLDAIGQAATGMVEIAKAVWDRVLSGATHNIATSAGRRLRTLQDFGVYEGGAVWIDTVNGTPGTTDFENGTVSNHVDNIADAITIATSVGLKIFHVLPGSSITAAASLDGYEFTGFSYTIALGGQSVSGTLFENATITGNDDGTNGTETVYKNCMMGTNTLGKHKLMGCGLGGVITLAEATDYFWDQCHSAIAGTATPSVDFQSAAETKNLSIRHYSGGIELRNHGAGGGTHTTSIEGHGQVVLAATCSGGTVAIRGNFGLTETGSVGTLSDGARIAEDQNIGIDWSNVANPTTALDLSGTDIQLVDTTTTNTDMRGTDSAALASVCTETRLAELDAANLPADIAGLNDPTAATIADAVWNEAVSGHTTAGTYGERFYATISGAAEAGTLSTTQMTTDLAEATDDHYNGRIICWTSGVLLGQATDITDYAGATGLLTFTAVTEAPSATDTFVIF